MSESLRDWNKGSRLSAAHLQEPVDVLRRLLATPNAGVGQPIGLRDGRRVFDLLIGKIVSSSYTDERYNVTAQYALATAATDDAMDFSDVTPVDTEQVTFTVTNLREAAIGTHLLPEGEFVLIMAVYDAQEAPMRHWVMSEAVASAIPVKLSDPTGSNGTQTAAPTYTYTVKDISGTTTLGSTMTPEVSRPFGAVTAASYGLAYYLAGELHLLIAFEVPWSGSCPT